jgi:peptidylprolyl isomerase
VRKTVALVVAAAFVFTLAGCTDLPQTVDNCVPAASSGSASKAVSADGTFGKDPKATVPTPTATKTVQVSTLKEGTGPVLGTDDIALLQYTIYAGVNGQLLGSSGANGYTNANQYTTVIGVKADPIGKDLTCQRVGSRTVAVETAKQFFGSASSAQSSGLTANDVLVVVADITKGYRGRATGALAPLKSGFPSVVTATNGRPGVTLDLQTPPKKPESETIRKGTGAVIKKSDTIIVQIEGIGWTTNPAPTDTFENTWTSHKPVISPAVSVNQSSSSAFDPSSSKALIGQTVGSQVLVVVPPKYGYPSSKTPQGYPTGETLVFVYDILGIR